MIGVILSCSLVQQFSQYRAYLICLWYIIVSHILLFYANNAKRKLANFWTKRIPVYADFIKRSYNICHIFLLCAWFKLMCTYICKAIWYRYHRLPQSTIPSRLALGEWVSSAWIVQLTQVPQTATKNRTFQASIECKGFFCLYSWYWYHRLPQSTIPSKLALSTWVSSVCTADTGTTDCHKVPLTFQTITQESA